MEGVEPAGKVMTETGVTSVATARSTETAGEAPTEARLTPAGAAWFTPEQTSSTGAQDSASATVFSGSGNVAGSTSNSISNKF